MSQTLKALAAALALSLLPAVAAAQLGPQPTGPRPTSAPPLDPQGAPSNPHNFTGFWGRIGGDHILGMTFPDDVTPPAKVLPTIDQYLQPWAVQKHKDFDHKEYDLGQLQRTPEGDCQPFSMPGERQETRIAFRIVSTPAVVLVIGGSDNFRLIHIDKAHPKPLQSSWMGHSIGHWEGDTLVVDTQGFNALGTLEDGVHHTDKLHMTARYTLRRNGTVFEGIYTYEDPGSLIKPMKFARVLPLEVKGEFYEQEDRCAGRASY